MRRYWKLVAIVPITCSLTALLFSLILPEKYEAEATVTVSDPSGNVSAADMLAVVNDFAEDEISIYEGESSDINATVTMGTGSFAQRLVVSIEGQDKERCVSLANSIARSAAEASEEAFQALQEVNESGLADLGALNTSSDVASVLSGTLLQDTLGTDRTFEFCTFMVGDAVEAEESSLGTAELMISGLVLGILIVILLLITYDKIRMPIKSYEDVESVVDLPMLNLSCSEGIGNELWANIQFVSSGTPRSICLIPLAGGCLEGCARSLGGAIEEFGLDVAYEAVPRDKPPVFNDSVDAICIYKCESICAGVGAAYCAHEASVTVVCVNKWIDTRRDVEKAMKELSLSGARVAGMVLLS